MHVRCLTQFGCTLIFWWAQIVSREDHAKDCFEIWMRFSKTINFCAVIVGIIFIFFIGLNHRRINFFWILPKYLASLHFYFFYFSCFSPLEIGLKYIACLSFFGLWHTRISAHNFFHSTIIPNISKCYIQWLGQFERIFWQNSQCVWGCNIPLRNVNMSCFRLKWKWCTF